MVANTHGCHTKKRSVYNNMSIMDRVRAGMQSFLQINPPAANSINLQEYLDWSGNAIKNRIWYRGDGAELEQLYWQLIQFNTQRQMFWASHPTPGIEMRKIHTGLPAMIVDLLADIIKAAVNDVNILEGEETVIKDLWADKIGKENDLKSLIEKCVSETLVIGDGAFKVSIDKSVSEYPIIEYWGGDKVEFVYKRGRIIEVVFKSLHVVDTGTYELHERYGRGYVYYELFKGGDPIDLTVDPAFRELVNVEWDSDLILAVPCMFYHSAKYPGRGQSIFDRKIDAFDSFDEAYSQWIDALRAGRTKEYIPENLIPRNPKTGKLTAPNAFDNRYIMTESDLREKASNTITTASSEIQHESYAATYSAALELCLLKLLSPSTLGIDVKKLDNAEAQREKEKVTLYTRDGIIEVLQPILEKVVDTAIRTNALINGETLPAYTVEVSFQSYANPSFESQVETIGKAKTAGIMSIETCVEELYGDSRDSDWKATEVARLKGDTTNGDSTGSKENMPDEQSRSEEAAE